MSIQEGEWDCCWKVSQFWVQHFFGFFWHACPLCTYNSGVCYIISYTNAPQRVVWLHFERTVQRVVVTNGSRKRSRCLVFLRNALLYKIHPQFLENFIWVFVWKEHDQHEQYQREIVMTFTTLSAHSCPHMLQFWGFLSVWLWTVSILYISHIRQ